MYHNTQSMTNMCKKYNSSYKLYIYLFKTIYIFFSSFSSWEYSDLNINALLLPVSLSAHYLRYYNSYLCKLKYFSFSKIILLSFWYVKLNINSYWKKGLFKVEIINLESEKIEIYRELFNHFLVIISERNIKDIKFEL